MFDDFSIYKNEECPVCNGLKYIKVLNHNCQHTNGEYDPCEYCHGRGYLKVLKNEYGD